MNKISEVVSEDLRDKIKKQEQPQWVQPMLAKLTHQEFSNKEWIFERKLDGVRCLVFKNDHEVHIMSRNANNLNSGYPEIVEAVENQETKNFIIDGEIVAFREDVTSFSELQKRMHLKDPQEIKGHETEVFYYVFDIIHLENLDLSDLPLLERKKLLEKFIDFNNRIRFTSHRKEKGLEYLEQACHDKWEGLIAKKADSKYTFGRSSNWLKFKCSNEQEFIIGGFTEPAGNRTGFGSLLLGYYEKGRLRYAGKVGTGFTNELLDDLYREMSRLEKKESPFSDPNQIRSKGIHWLKPELIGQVSFTEWTKSGKLRHPSFLGLRRDKDPKDVKREG